MNENQTQEMTQPQKLDVSVKVFLNPMQEDSKRLASASVTLGGCFAIRGVQVVDGEKGAFVSMPQRKDSKGEYRDICFPITPELREEINTAVLGEYQKTMERAFSRAGETMEKRASTREKLEDKKSEIPPPQPMRGSRARNKGER